VFAQNVDRIAKQHMLNYVGYIVSLVLLKSGLPPTFLLNWGNTIAGQHMLRANNGLRVKSQIYLQEERMWKMEVNLILYNLDSCPECRAVREKLSEMKMAYVCVNIDPIKEKRNQVYAVSGQYGVPVLVDGNRVLTTQDSILKYLTEYVV